MAMKVSVITVCFNAENAIEKTINSVISQTYTDIEYLVVDGASSDKTVSIIERYLDNIDFFISEPDSGVYDAMNKGIMAATGDILFFLNVDDVFMDPLVVEKVVEEYSKGQVNLLYGDIIVLQSDKSTILKKHLDVDKMYFLHNTICHQAIFFQAEVFKTCGLFDTGYKIAGDYEWLLRAFLRQKLTFKYIELPIAVYADGGISSSEKFRIPHQIERENIQKTYFTEFEKKLYLSKFMYTVKKVSALKIVVWKLLGWNLSSFN